MESLLIEEEALWSNTGIKAEDDVMSSQAGIKDGKGHKF
jgi:hypothetical protein